MANDGTMYPGLLYDDAPAAIAFLEKAFGFETVMNVPGEDGTVAHAELRLGEGIVLVASSSHPHVVSGGPRAPRGYVYVFVEDVKAHYERAKAAGAEIMRDYEEKDYGGAGYSVRDPEGLEWSFGSYRPGVAE